MKIKQQYLKIIIITIVITLFCGSFAFYNVYVNVTKQRFNTQIITRMQLLLMQQQSILRQLSQNILDPIKNQDIITIVANIRAYENMLFTFSRFESGLPGRIRFVSLSVPQHILGANGKLSNKSLVQDEKYYIDVMSNPNVINISKTYEELAMPGFLLCNWGLGILDHDANFHGQLDVQVSVNALHDYLVANNLHNSPLFNFKLNVNNILQPDILMDRRAYLCGLFVVWGMVLVSILLIMWASKFIYVLYRKYKQQQHELTVTHENLNQLMANKNIVQSSRQVQYKYGVLAANDACVESLIDIQQILQDAYAVNAEDAAERNIKIIVPVSVDSSLKFYGNRLRLMQILSGIIGEGVNVLPANSIMKLQIEIIRVQDNLQQIVFKFHDNGFYNKLEHRHVLTSNVDVRVQGWDNINHLIDLELGELQHIHTAYTGNTISLSITRKIERKVVSIESYY